MVDGRGGRTSVEADVRRKDMDLSKDYVTEWRTYIAESLQREVGELRNEEAELRHAIEQVGECDYRAECPVLKRLQRTAKRPVSRFKIQVPSL